jgi:hypothetical protein
MSRLRFRNNSLLIFFISGIWILLANMQKFHSPKYQTIPVSFPKDKGKLSDFSTMLIFKIIRGKSKLPIELNGDISTNQKKIFLIKQEARKLKYTKNVSSFIDISITDAATYGEIVQLFDICEQDDFRMYALLKNRFIIFGESPLPPKDTTKKISLIYL